MLNGEFETNTSGWSVEGTCTITRQTTTFVNGAASAAVLTDGTDAHGVTFSMSGDAAQTSNWDATGYVKAHAAGDVGAQIVVGVDSVGGSSETFASSAFTLTAGWTQVTVTATFANASHTAALVCFRQKNAHAAFTFDLDAVQYARHLTYAPSGRPDTTALWLPGVPAGNFSSAVDATTTALIASGLYAGA